MNSGREDRLWSTPTTVEIAGRGSVAVWDCGPERIPESSAETQQTPLLLLHGWNVDARVNYASVMPLLSQRRRVVTFDLHGHGRGVRSDNAFDIGRCADDAVAVLDALDIDRAVVVGYSLGGAVAQVMGSAHRERCEALVLMATAGTFAESRREAAQFSFLDQSARAMRRLPARPRDLAFRRISSVACRRYPPWILDAVRTADPVTLLEAGAQLGRFDASTHGHPSGPPAAVIVTAADTVVPPARQHGLARLVDANEVIEVHADHDLPIRDDPRFADALERAIEAVTRGVHSGSLG